MLLGTTVADPMIGWATWLQLESSKFASAQFMGLHPFEVLQTKDDFKELRRNLCHSYDFRSSVQ